MSWTGFRSARQLRTDFKTLRSDVFPSKVPLLPRATLWGQDGPGSQRFLKQVKQKGGGV